MTETSFRELIVRTIELYKERRKVDKELEEKKEEIRRHSDGKRNRFSILGLGKVLVAARRTKGLDVDLKNLNNLNRKQLAWLINQNVLRLSLNSLVFRSLDKNAQKRIMATGCIRQSEYEDGQHRQRVSIRIEEDDETRDSRNLHDSNLPSSRDASDIEEEIDEGYDEYEEYLYYEEYLDEAEMIARNLDDDRDELARSQEDGWPYADADDESAEQKRFQEEG